MTPMKPSTADITPLAGSDAFSAMPQVQPRRPFDPLVLAFLDALSRVLMTSAPARGFPDVITFAFFCRQANLRKWAHQQAARAAVSVGRGVTFHVAPSNVPINFAFSLVAGLLAGNACIVRVSSKPFAQTDLVCAALRELLAVPEFAPLAAGLAVVGYGHDAQTNQFFSSLCDVRLIWGGDATIREIRQAELPARATEITFADRYSLCVINVDGYLALADPAKVAQDFYNDTYLFDQNACSSPRLIYWVGAPAQVAQAKEAFWANLHALLKARAYRVEALTSVNKYAVACRAALQGDAEAVEAMPDNLITRIRLTALSGNLDQLSCAGGSFLEYEAESVQGLAQVVTRKFQTLTYLGFDAAGLREHLLAQGAVGIDRIVPCGRASEFGLVWDGYDLIASMSRIVDLL